jgi:hypothetical protein
MPLVQPNARYSTYQSRSVWASSGDANSDQTPSGSLTQLSRIQDTTFTLNYPLTEGVYLDASVEQYNPTPPSVNVDVRYWHTNGLNELALGLARLDSSGTLILGLDEEKNLYVAMEDAPGIDSIGAARASPRTVLGLGNAVMTAYEVGAQVGGLIESRATLNCLTANVYTGYSGVTIPAVNCRNGGSQTGRFVIPEAFSQYNSSPLVTGQAAALGAQELMVAFPENTPFGATLTGQNACYLQSFNLALTIDRQEQKPLGYVYPTARPVMYPIKVDLSAEALMSSYQSDALERFGCNSTGFAIQMMVKQPCSNLVLFSFYMNNLQLQSQSISQSIGPIDGVSLRWHGLITNPRDMFFDPSFNYLVTLSDTGAYGTQW